MGQVRHGSATTTHAVRATIQRSQASLARLSNELGINPKTVAKWRKRATVEDLKTGPKEARSTVLTEAEEATIVAFNGIEHRLTKPNHPWTNGQVERMNRTIKDATVKRFHYDNHEQLRVHLADFMAAYNFARRLKTLGGLTPYEYIYKIWTSEPDRFILNPIHQMPGINT